MDKTTLAERLNAAPDGTFMIRDVHYAHWGSEIVFLCSYQPPGLTVAMPFKLVLNDCREMQWRVYAHLRAPEDQTLPEATLVNILLGRDSHRKPLHILTDFFGMNVSYGTLMIEKS